MYKIVAYDSPTSTTPHVIFNPATGFFVSDGKLSLKENGINSLELTVSTSNYLYRNAKSFITHIEVYQDSKLLFRGRCLDVTSQMKDDGQFCKSLVFEDIQNYLQDSIQRYAKVQNTTPREFFKQLIDSHNAQVPAYKRFIMRDVNVTNSTDNVYRYVDYVSTWETIKDKLVSRLGGYIRTEYKNGTNYIDYLTNIGEDHKEDTAIKISVNMKSASVKFDPTELITRLVPLGATIENDDQETATSASNPRVTIASVNDGKDFLDMYGLQDEFGVIVGSNVWDDVHDSKILLSKAKDWIKKQKVAQDSWEIDALELPKFDSFNVSDRYMFINEYVANKQLLRVIEKDIDFNQPNKSSLKIANKSVSLSDYQNQHKDYDGQIQSLKARVVSQSGEINTLNSQTLQMNKTIKEQLSIISQLQADVDGADLSGIANKLNSLSASIDDLKNEINSLDYVTSSEFNSYKVEQNQRNVDFENRILLLESGGQ